MTDLFALDDLRYYLNVAAVDTEPMTRARRYASGWLLNATRLTPWPPSLVPDDIWAWAVELAAIAYRNPAGAASESIDDYNVSYDAERRKEILDAARLAYSGAGVASYSFPDWDWHWDITPVVDPLTQ